MNKDDYRGDVIYEVWRRGGNIDRVDDDRVSDYYYDGYDYEQAAYFEMRRLYPPETTRGGD